MMSESSVISKDGFWVWVSGKLRIHRFDFHASSYILIITPAPYLAQFELTPKSKRGLAASDHCLYFALSATQQ